MCHPNVVLISHGMTHAHFSIVGRIPFLLAAIFGGSSLYRKYYRTSRYQFTPPCMHCVTCVLTIKKFTSNHTARAGQRSCARRVLSLNRYLQRLCNRLKFRSSNRVIDIIVSALIIILLLLLTAAFSKGSWWTLAYNWDQLRSSMRMATPRQK